MLYLGFVQIISIKDILFYLQSLNRVAHCPIIANSLKVESHASILNRLVHAQKTSVAKFFEHLEHIGFGSESK